MSVYHLFTYAIRLTRLVLNICFAVSNFDSHSQDTVGTVGVPDGRVQSDRVPFVSSLRGCHPKAGALTLPLLLPSGVGVHFFKDSRVIMRDDEPTSIIAFTLR